MNILSSAINPKQSELYLEFTNGIETDLKFYEEEFSVQMAWVQELYFSNYLSKLESEEILTHLKKIKFKISNIERAGSFKDEDIHMMIENELTKINPELGKKIHLGRSRNDLVATSLKLYTSKIYLSFSKDISFLIQTLLLLSNKDLDIIVPSFTHSQSAQPIRMSHLWNFHAINFLTDLEKINLLYKSCLEIMPLGSSAIAGTHLNLDLQRMAEKLGFAMSPMNSIYGVSDRDFLVDLTFIISRISMHIIRLCEDIIFYSSTHIGIISLPNNWSSGSSAMPNKKNPDFFEIVRAQSKHLSSLNLSVIHISSSFGGGYSSDFHELKKIVLNDLGNMSNIIFSLASACKDLEINQKKSIESLNKGHILATEISNQFVELGIPFRDSYTKVADLIIESELSNTQISYSNIDVLTSVESKTSSGGTSKKQIQNTIDWILNRLNKI